ncbi:MAG: ribulose-phosphate 3-epimerase [Candidatus Omnitrophota bacterium]|nr:ribulose-phosphate 3-epimerase [Candidatus Omnitrophota bacterium]
MKKLIEVSASILAADFAHLADEIKKSEDAGVDRFHVDVMDGHFVPNLTIGPVIVEAVRRHTRLPVEAHLMIEHPWDYIEAYVKAGADIIQIQVECYVDSIDAGKLRADLKKIRSLGKKAHIVINPGTPLITDVLGDCDGVLVMSVNPGYAGQKFMPQALPKIEHLAKTFQGDIGVDGGINGDTAPLCVKAGARVLITASYLYGSKDLKGVVAGLKAL